MGSFSSFEERSLSWIRQQLAAHDLLDPGTMLLEDAAQFRSTSTVSICTDAHVAGVHFPQEDAGEVWPGYRAVQATLSDLAASAAVPAKLLVSIVWPWPHVGEQAFRSLYSGVIEAAKEQGIKIIGGNISGGTEISLHCTAIGFHNARPLATFGQVGDILAVSGSIGDAALGCRLHSASTGKVVSDEVQQAINAYRRPKAEIAWALTAAPFLRGATDISDGLQTEISRLCRFGRCGVSLDAARIPRSLAWQSLADRANPSEVWGSDDYRLLVAVAPENWTKLQRRLEKIGRRVYSVGVLNSAKWPIFVELNQP